MCINHGLGRALNPRCIVPSLLSSVTLGLWKVRKLRSYTRTTFLQYNYEAAVRSFGLFML